MHIDAVKGTLVNEKGEICKLRPKTFQLLMFLLRSPETTFSKSEIMQSVWSDVVVGEHVIFQSIKEIRQVFAQQEVIKTQPRLGYSWVAPVSQSNKEAADSLSNIQSFKQSITPTFVTLVFTSILLIFVLVKLSAPEPQEVRGSIVILPVQVATDDNDHDWVALGGMDQLTQRLASSSRSGVLHTDYVLEVMDRANVSSDKISEDDIKQIFMVSGASLVVELVLAGTPRDYQLSYKLHRRNGVNKGVLFGEHIREVFEQVAQKLAVERGIGLVAQASNYNSGFANEIVANALEAKRNKDTERAEQLLQTAILSDSDNLLSKRLLLEIWVANREFSKSDPLVEDVVSQINTSTSPNREHVRLYFWAAMNQLQKQDLNGAEPYLAKSEALATQLKDWLYLAYAAEIRGQMAQFNKDYIAAELAYTKAMDYHEILQCPHGQSNGLLNLSMLAAERGDDENASLFLTSAMSLIEQRELNTLLPKAQQWQAQLN